MSTDLTNPHPLPTPARLSLGRTAPSIATHDHLQFQLDHALARDAVHTQLDIPTLIRGLKARDLESLILRSSIEPGPNARRIYLRRPDLGRKLHPDSAAALQSFLHSKKAVISTEAQRSGEPPVSRAVQDPSQLTSTQILFILADGLSAQAIERHALLLLDATLPLIPNPSGVPGERSLLTGVVCSLIPLLQNARVAIADEIGYLLHANLTILFIGERPGLSDPDSLGVYLTWNPHPGRTDAERNCISNIRHEGLSYAEAAHRIAWYVAEATRLRTTGIALKDPALSLLPSS
jgi:ethanolamine ammonia-lyase small subunit